MLSAIQSADLALRLLLELCLLGVLASHAFGEKWIEWQRAVALRSRSSFVRVTDTKAHNIHLRHPEMVVQAIRDVAALAGFGGSSSHNAQLAAESPDVVG